MLEFALRRHGADPTFDADTVACFLVGAQVRTYTYATVLYNWGGAGFAKLNVRQTEWPRDGSQGRYFADLQPPYPNADQSDVSPAVLAAGERLVTQGDPARKLPACIACHGARMTGQQPGIPGLLGLHASVKSEISGLKKVDPAESDWRKVFAQSRGARQGTADPKKQVKPSP